MPPATVVATPTCTACGRTLTHRPVRACNHQAARREGLCFDCYEASATWKADETEFYNNTYNLGSERKFGIEIETSECPNYRSIRDKTLWGAKYDCSITGMEFVSPILDGDMGLETVTEICEMAKDKRWKVDRDCGLHIHLDMRGEKRDALKSIAYAYLVTENLWASFVAPERVEYSMCRESELTRRMIANAPRFTNLARNQDRFEWLNIAAYIYMRTFEIRSHQGSLNAREIRYWIRAHLRFVEYVKGMTFDEIDTTFDRDPWAALRRCWGEPRLSRYYGRKRSVNRRRSPMQYA